MSTITGVKKETMQNSNHFYSGARITNPRERGDNGSLLSVAGYVGSALITVKPSEDNTISVSIFNITSLSSGDLGKLNPLNKEAQSVVRDPNSKYNQPYTNIAQYFSFTMKR